MIKWIRDHRSLKNFVLIVFALSASLVPLPPASAQSNVSCADNLQSSAIAWAGNSVVMVASANLVAGGNLYYFWQPAGGQTWNRQLVADANGGSCPGNCTGWCPLTVWGYESDAIVWSGGDVMIAAVDQRNGGLYYWYQPKGTTGWHQETIANGPPGCCQFGNVQNGQTTPTILGYSMPSIAWTGSAVVVAACDQLGTLHYWYQNRFTTAWNHEVVGLAACYGQPSIAWTGQSVVIASQGLSGLWYYWQGQGSRTWNPQYVGLGSSPSIAWTGNAVVITAVGYANGGESVEYFWQAQGTRPWISQQVFGQGSGDSYGDDFSTPSVTATDQSVVVNAGVNVPYADRLNYAWESMSSTSAPAWSVQNASQLGTGEADYSAFTSGPRSIAWTGSSVVMTSTTACGDLDYWWQGKGSPSWQHQRVVTNAGWPPGTC